MISEGEKLPDGTFVDSEGVEQTLADVANGPFILFFYPKASTPGCTTEAQEFSAAKTDFEAAGFSVIGMSADSPKRQSNFIAKNDLTVPLLSDESTDWLEKIGVWAEKKNYGKTYMGIIRTTLLVDADRTVKKVWSPVRVKGHVDAVLAEAKGEA